MKPKPAIPCAMLYQGKKYLRWTVLITISTGLLSNAEIVVPVIAATAGDALELVRHELYAGMERNVDWIHPFEVTTWGTRGGVHRRWSGWESCVGGALLSGILSKGNEQLLLL